MKSEIKIFENEKFGNVRITMGEDGKPLFCLVDVCKILDLRVDGVLPRLKENGYNLIGVIDSLGRNQKAYFINEKNLYRVIMRSDKDEATEFQDWVCDEVLPSIRENGIYATDNVIDKILNNPDFGIELLTKLKEERQARIEAEKKNAILMHVNKTYTATEVAKELNMKSAIELNKKLAELKVQYQINGTWVMFSKYSDQGFEEIKQEVLDNGKVIYHRRITQLGRDFIVNLINNSK